MLKRQIILIFVTAGLLIAGLFVFGSKRPDPAPIMISHVVDIRTQAFQLYWKDDTGQIFGNIQKLKNWLDAKGEKLVFAMNAGMFKSDRSSQGLFIQDHKTLEKLDTASGNGNFYLKPNGVFYTTTGNQAFICKTADFSNNPEIKYATQSGPMLVTDGQIHPAFKEGSINLHLRNGVGILPDGKVLFAMSKEKINLFDFASYFKNAGCRNALYLDGFVSRMYLPEKDWIQMDGDLGVIIGVTGN